MKIVCGCGGNMIRISCSPDQNGNFEKWECPECGSSFHGLVTKGVFYNITKNQRKGGD